MPYKNSEARRASWREYKKRQDPEKRREYIREYSKRPDVIARRKEKTPDYSKRYMSKPGIKERYSEYKKVRDLKDKYGLTLEDFAELLEHQGGACAICGEQSPRRWVVDHDHDDGDVRGILCDSCNFILGHSKDSTVTLRSAIAYLEKV